VPLNGDVTEKFKIVNDLLNVLSWGGVDETIGR
jgi:hypothetical protein